MQNFKLLIILVFILVAGCSNKESVETEVNNNIESEFEEEVEINEPIPKRVIINGYVLTESEIAEMGAIYGVEMGEGEYWYDSVSGLQGRVGYPAAGFIYPGHNFGEVSVDASNGNTGVILNGRELTELEVQYLEGILQVERQPGYYWLDSQGNLGVEGQAPFANVYGSGSSESYVWSSSVTGAGAGGSGDCSYVNIPGDTGISDGFVSNC